MAARRTDELRTRGLRSPPPAPRLDWFAGIGILPPAAELDALLGDAGPQDGSIICVPALQGLGTPSWNAEIRGAMLGLTRASTRAQLTRAVVDGVVHQVADALGAIATRTAVETVFMDGGMARSDWVLQRVADLAGVEVRRAARPEATAIGAAMAAGLAVGRWDLGDFGQPATDRIATPAMAKAEREALRSRWAEAVELVGRWRH